MINNRKNAAMSILPAFKKCSKTSSSAGLTRKNLKTKLATITRSKVSLKKRAQSDGKI